MSHPAGRRRPPPPPAGHKPLPNASLEQPARGGAATSLLGNILWIVLGGGLVLAFEYVVVGLALCCTIVGIPFGIQCMKLAELSLSPFGREVRDREKAAGCTATVMNILWMVTGGIIVSLTHVFFALLCAITIIGIPFARQHVKLASLAFTPFGKQVV